MSQVTVVPEKNRSYVTVGGHLDPGEQVEVARAFESVATLEEAEALLDALGPGTEPVQASAGPSSAATRATTGPQSRSGPWRKRRIVPGYQGEAAPSANQRQSVR